jgi:hypothetical protein
MSAYNGVQVGTLSTLVLLGSGALAVWGIWAVSPSLPRSRHAFTHEPPQLLFEQEGSFSRKTGADKHTSSFLFGNKSAASKQKKEWKKQQSS